MGGVGMGIGGARFSHPLHLQFEQWRPAFLHAHLLVLHLEAVVQLQHGSCVRAKLRQVVGGCSLGELGSASGHRMVAGWLISPRILSLSIVVDFNLLLYHMVILLFYITSVLYL